MNGGTRLHMIFLLILILATTMVVLLFTRETMNEGFGNEILDIPGAKYGAGQDNGISDPENPLSPMDPGPGFYAFNVGTIDAPQWKRKSVPYGYRRDPTDFTKLVPVSESAIATATPGLNDVELIAPPFLQIPGALYDGDKADYGLDKKPPASGFYKIRVIKKTTDPGANKKYIWKKYDYFSQSDKFKDRFLVFFENTNENKLDTKKLYKWSVNKWIKTTNTIEKPNVDAQINDSKKNIEGEFTVKNARYYYTQPIGGNTGTPQYYNIVYYQKTIPNGYVADRKELIETKINPGTILYNSDPTQATFSDFERKYTKLVYQAPEIPKSEIEKVDGLRAIEPKPSESEPIIFEDGYFIINFRGDFYKKLIPNGYDISGNDPKAEYKKPPLLNTYTPLKYNPNFTPDKYDPKFEYDATDIDREYRDKSYGKTDDVNMGKYWMFDEEGKLIEVNTEMNKSPILYYIPGAYKFGASNYVPNYEDSVYLSRTTRESQLAPVVNTASQLGGFCSQYATNTAALEEKCAAQDLNACASTSCCVLLGGQKCVAGNENGPKNPANYTDYSLMNRDFYYYQGKCYGNCK